MKFVGTVKRKIVDLNEVDIVLTIEELTDLIEFLNHAKKICGAPRRQ